MTDQRKHASLRLIQSALPWLLVSVIAGWLIGPGLVGSKDWSAPAVITLVLAASALILTAVAVIVGALAIFGYHAIKQEATLRAEQKAEVVAKEEAASVAARETQKIREEMRLLAAHKGMDIEPIGASKSTQQGNTDELVRAIVGDCEDDT